jgi:tRNA-Thr(GGU) m(6)t(6)A37 methyltransferase TsaA
METVTLTPIGVVRSPRTEPTDDFWGSVISTIELEGFSPETLLGLTDFSHIEVVYLFHKVKPDNIVLTAGHPRENPDWPRVGIFSQRKKNRPNRLGVSVCRLIKVDGVKITVQALDAIDGTPVLDIKPYVREFAPARETVRQAEWQTELMKDYFS